ncbi:HNH endonuclease [Myxococcus sp. RHSTA-1-4]|uniref:HNH endonuclease n=1 Tax=Myxococcus sp. RHSTA-1-4 TaxID=2874601 RepID=UPI001CC15EC9|nr:HNH endonuclease signature motif containing protein [Myxococcus sp. RHSTA-1-4]
MIGQLLAPWSPFVCLKRNIKLGKPTSSQAKSTIKSSLLLIVDPELRDEEKDRVWSYFGSACGYCGRKLNRAAREGHVDHLIPVSLGGRNHIGNRVLACAACNGNEKRDLPWEPFLKSKCTTPDAFAARRARIDAWKAHFGTDDLQLPPDVLAVLEAATARVFAAYDAAVEEVRALKNKMD